MFSKVFSNPFLQEKKGSLPGFLTQYPGVPYSGQKQQLVMGIDFGTAFSKVIIGASPDRFAVPFPGIANRENDFLLPGILTFDAAGECQLGSVEFSKRPITNLKMRLLQGDYSNVCLTEIAAFLSLLMRHSRGWFLNEQRKTYDGKNLDWYVNVGLPTDSYHDEQLTSIYQDLIRVAWAASVDPGPIKLANIARVLEQRGGIDDLWSGKNEEVVTGHIHADSIGLFPEFVAQITGYVRSPMRRSDLHALVDVGAGTIDATMFNVIERDGEDAFPIFSKSVKPLGVQFLVKHRLSKSHYQGQWQPKVHEKPPDKMKFARMLNLSLVELDRIDSTFREKVYDQLIGGMKYTKEKRYRNSRRWQSGIPFFLCGGGAKMDFYVELIDSIESTGGRYKIQRINLPRPDRLIAQNLPVDAYNRLSVAYGLSFDALDIGEIVKANQIPDDSAIKPSESIFCNRCGGTGEPMGNCPKCGGSGLDRNC